MTEINANDGAQESAGKLLTVQDLADRLQVPKSWVYDRTRISGSNGFPVLRVGKYLRFDFEKVVTWLENQ